MVPPSCSETCSIVAPDDHFEVSASHLSHPALKVDQASDSTNFPFSPDGFFSDDSSGGSYRLTDADGHPPQ